VTDPVAYCLGSGSVWRCGSDKKKQSRKKRTKSSSTQTGRGGGGTDRELTGPRLDPLDPETRECGRIGARIEESVALVLVLVLVLVAVAVVQREIRSTGYPAQPCQLRAFPGISDFEAMS
jgi:hypothetical protein